MKKYEVFRQKFLVPLFTKSGEETKSIAKKKVPLFTKSGEEDKF